MTQNQLSKAADVTADLPALKITREDITKHFCKMATDTEVAMALAIVKSLNLNPFMHEVHFIKYSQNDKMAIVVGYNVYLKRAERSGKLAGWKAGIDKEAQVSWVEIHRKDWIEPFRWEVSLAEFDKKQSTWKQIPSFMAKKVAIAQGFRMAFPDELGGLPYTEYEHEVYDVSGKETSMKPEVQIPKAITAQEQPKTAEIEPTVESSVSEEKTQPQENPIEKVAIVEPSDTLKALESLAILAFKTVGKKKADWINFLGSEYGCDKVSDMTEDQIEKCKKHLNEMIKDAKK